MEVTKEIDVRDEILAHIKQDERPLSWLAKKSEIKYPTMYSIFVHKIMNLSDDNLSKINTVLGTDFKKA